MFVCAGDVAAISFNSIDVVISLFWRICFWRVEFESGEWGIRWFFNDAA